MHIVALEHKFNRQKASKYPQPLLYFDIFFCPSVFVTFFFLFLSYFVSRGDLAIMISKKIFNKTITPTTQNVVECVRNERMKKKKKEQSGYQMLSIRVVHTFYDLFTINASKKENVR